MAGLIITPVHCGDAAEDFAASARAFSEKGDFVSAEIGYNRAISLAQTNPVYYFERAKVKILKGQLTAAIVDLKIALIFAPHYDEAAEELIALYCRLENYNEAHQVAQSILAQKDIMPTARFYLWSAIAAHELALEEIARERIEQALKLGSDDLLTHFYHAKILLALQEFDGAYASISRAIKLQPEDPALYATRAFISLAKWVVTHRAAEQIPKELAESIQSDLYQFEGSHPDFCDPLDTRALFLMITGKWNDAARKLKTIDRHRFSARQQAIRLIRLYLLGVCQRKRQDLPHILEENGNDYLGLPSWLRNMLNSIRRHQPLHESLSSELQNASAMSMYWLLLGIQYLENNPRKSRIYLELASLHPVTFEALIARMLIRDYKH
ncbi:MAG: hypothetical protein D6820_08710 [Lentisphaerae bacterium]|nr:MAG: hypothetical protein D6820_08710 [Lentisphaerota bacterium]